mmetsp:Transcript_8028/g.17926  ORF Transcript_8028/g.17926 Transcript_8028/m.17926 type:complete len:301 (-) Transcript_8028:107-1009(-)
MAAEGNTPPRHSGLKDASRIRKDEDLRVMERSAKVWRDNRMHEMQAHVLPSRDGPRPSNRTSQSLPALHAEHPAQRKHGVESFNKSILRLNQTSLAEPPMARLDPDAQRSPQGKAFHSSFFDHRGSKSEHSEGLFLQPPQGLPALARKTLGSTWGSNAASWGLPPPATPPTPSRSYRREADRTLQRLLLDMELDRQSEVGEQTHGLVAGHFDARYEWFERHSKKWSRKPQPGPPYLQYKTDSKVMPGSMRIAQTTTSAALLRNQTDRAAAPKAPPTSLEATLSADLSPPSSPTLGASQVW